MRTFATTLSVLALLASTAQAQVAVEREIARAACHGRRPCRVEEVRDAGRDAAGNALKVVKLLLSPPSHPHADGSPAPDGDCARFEWTLVATRHGRLRAHPLVSICNDGYGARGIGEDQVEVSDNRFSHTRVGGSAWTWSESTTLSLAPLAVVGRGSSGGWSIGPNMSAQFVDYPALFAGGSWYSPVCGSEGLELAPEDEVRWVAIPRVMLGRAELAAVRRGVDLGTCGTVIDGEVLRGAMLEGDADPSSASMRALWPEDGPLVLEIDDDEVTPDDRVEVWIGPERPSYMDHCREETEVVPPQGYAIRVSDGHVEALSGGVAPEVERRVVSGRVILLVTMPRETRTLTVVLADADGSSGVVRRIASSTLHVTDAASLGDVAGFDSATCRLSGGALRASVDTRVDTPGPVIGDP